MSNKQILCSHKFIYRVDAEREQTDPKKQLEEVKKHLKPMENIVEFRKNKASKTTVEIDRERYLESILYYGRFH